MIDAMRDFAANSRTGRIRSGSGRPAQGMAARAAGKVAIVVYDGVGVFELGVACDVSDPAAVANMVEQVVQLTTKYYIPLHSKNLWT